MNDDEAHDTTKKALLYVWHSHREISNNFYFAKASSEFVEIFGETIGWWWGTLGDNVSALASQIVSKPQTTSIISQLKAISRWCLDKLNCDWRHARTLPRALGKKDRRTSVFVCALSTDPHANCCANSLQLEVKHKIFSFSWNRQRVQLILHEKFFFFC